ncbi:hypothetical protein EG327_011744 [Venturia inaequalis]|uniref:Multicopper oxidase n=1 Tax=Venturia inaequalis TaxID=5025 RepID=A0A8H3YNY3_VENIN|nr:hypothetical protein EG327_011744 [Venturia inaequalis]
MVWISSSLLFAASFASLGLAKTVIYDWDIGWVNRCPDGFCRPVIGINDQWPLPIIECDLDDTVVININNSLGNETTSIHYHGQYQRGTNEMDGVAMGTQCPIPSGGRFTQVFKVQAGGTHWYHSHDKAQYPDGLRAPMIVHDCAYEESLGYDKEYVFSVSDWYHEEMPNMLHQYFSEVSDFNGNMVMNMPMAPSSLINDTTSITLDMEPGKTYLIRMVSVAALFAHKVSFEDHDMTIVAIDGIPTNATLAKAVTIAAGQRYDVLVKGKSDPTKDYAISSLMVPASNGASGILRYSSKSMSTSMSVNENLAASIPIDDFGIFPLDGTELFSPVDQSITMQVSYSGLKERRIFLGDGTYVTPKIPTLYTALTTGSDAWNPAVYGAGANAYIINSGQIIQIVVQNDDAIEHPMHLHGYDFQVVARGSGPWDGDETKLPAVPMRRDTVTTPPAGHLVIRIKTMNPGTWMFHCHMEFHGKYPPPVTSDHG